MTSFVSMCVAGRPWCSPWSSHVFPMASGFPHFAGVRIDPRLAILYRPVQGLLDHPGAMAATKRPHKMLKSGDQPAKLAKIL